MNKITQKTNIKDKKDIIIIVSNKENDIKKQKIENPKDKDKDIIIDFKYHLQLPLYC
jgi:hypothetical protein